MRLQPLIKGSKMFSPQREHYKKGLYLLYALMLSLLLMSCTSRRLAPHKPTSDLEIKTILLIPFKKITNVHNRFSQVRCPICGAVFNTGPILDGAETFLTNAMLAFLKANTSYKVISGDQGEGARSQLISKNAGISEQELIREIGRTLNADAVVNGYLYRFRERIGTAYSVERSASVAFDIHLIRIADDRLIWVGRFDETQRSLSEDLFRISLFFKRGIRWLSAYELAHHGMECALATFPKR